MKQKHLLFFLLAFGTFSLPIHSQQYTIEELKQGFYDQYVEKKENTFFMSMEPLLLASGSDFLDNFGVKYFLCPSESLHQVEKLNIPPSNFVIYRMSDDKRILCWMSTLQDSDTKENVALRKTLQKKFGTIPLQGDTVLVPAKWFSGQIRYLLDPFVYGHEIVSDRLEMDSVADGVILARNKDQRYVYWTPSYLETDSRRISNKRTDTIIKVVMDGKPDVHLENARGMALYERDINRFIDNSLIPNDYEYDKQYAIMLYLDEGGGGHLNVLLPQELNMEDRLLLTILATAIENQPKHTFAGYVSARGRFPAIYLKAYFSKGHWTFEDYRFVDVYEAMKKPKH